MSCLIFEHKHDEPLTAELIATSGPDLTTEETSMILQVVNALLPFFPYTVKAKAHFDIYKDDNVMISQRNHAIQASERIVSAFFDVGYIQMVLYKMFKSDFEWKMFFKSSSKMKILVRKIQHDGARRIRYSTKNAFKSHLRHGKDDRPTPSVDLDSETQVTSMEDVKEIENRISKWELDLIHFKKLD
ncbi:hypothetical protein BGZ74_004891 [Mortierella antarctica]|nr:hypothetical protein BGZ74_004891 [Mortierella antarctica]